MTIERVHFKAEGHMYVSGDFECTYGSKTGKRANVYLYRSKAEQQDPDGSYTHYHPDTNSFIVYDGKGQNEENIIRFVKTSTDQSNDYIKYEFENGVIKLTTKTSDGQTRKYCHNYETGTEYEISGDNDIDETIQFLDNITSF